MARIGATIFFLTFIVVLVGQALDAQPAVQRLPTTPLPSGLLLRY